jgi:two-component system, chemotaxis family, response regulator PixG
MIAQREAKLAHISFKESIVQFKSIKQQSFSGNVIIEISTVSQWMFSFSLGRLASISGGLDSVNRWQRNLEIAQLGLGTYRFGKVDAMPTIEPHISAKTLLERQNIAQQWSAIEVLFDLIQLSQSNGDRITFKSIEISNNNNLPNLNLPLLDIELILQQAIQDWQEWQKAGLSNYSPSHFPTIDRLDPLTNRDLKQILLSIDGNQSLRGLAICHRQKLIDFTKSLMPLLELKEIVLVPRPKTKLIRTRNNRTANLTPNLVSREIDIKDHRSQQLVACIDDSIMVYEYLERILTDNGYRSFGVQDSLKIIPSLIKNKPDLIFLDLVMPFTNGYEICELIRKTPSLKNIPVAILTDRDKLVDRMRAKMIGANDFLVKPVRVASVLKVLDKHLKTCLSTNECEIALLKEIDAASDRYSLNDEFEVMLAKEINSACLGSGRHLGDGSWAKGDR